VPLKCVCVRTQPSLWDLNDWALAFPALKRRAIFDCPSGAGFSGARRLAALSSAPGGRTAARRIVDETRLLFSADYGFRGGEIVEAIVDANNHNVIIRGVIFHQRRRGFGLGHGRAKIVIFRFGIR
jgi:hypothetical protein